MFRRGFSWLWLSFAIFGLAVSASRAGWIEDQPGKTIIHVKLFDLPDPARTDTPTRADAAVVDRFRKDFPQIFAEKYRARYEADPKRYGHHDWSHVEIQLHRYSGIRVEGVENTLLAIAGGVAPDVIYVNFRMSDTYIQQGFLYPLDKPDDDYLTSLAEDEVRFRIHDKIWPVIERRGPNGQEHVWAIPYGGALGKVLLYRKDLFDEADLPYPDNNWTWNDFYTICKKLTDPARGIYGIHFSRGKHESWWWLTFLWSAGGDVMVYNETNDAWEAVFDSREAAIALEFYNRLCTEAWTDNQGMPRYGYAHRDADWGTTGAKWARGEIAMMFAYIDEKVFQRINPDVTGMVPVPRGPTGQRGAELNSMMMGLYAGIEDPAVRDAAWEYMAFYDCMKAARIRTQVMVEGGLGRFINPRYLRMFGYEELIRLAPRGWKECFEIALATGRPEPYGKNSNYAYNIMTRPLEQAEDLALNGELPDDPEERLTVFQHLLQDAVAEANQEMLGILPAPERRMRTVIASLVLILIIVIFTFVFRHINRIFSAGQEPGRNQWQFRRYAWGYVLLLPAVLTILAWQYLPLARGSLMAFQDYRIMGASAWTGLTNMGDVLWDREWWIAVWNTCRYSALVIALTFLPPVILAILLQEVPRGRILFRTLYYLPAVSTGLVVTLLWKSFYDPTERGVLNALLMHIPAIGFVILGFGLLTLCLCFARRLYYHSHPLLMILASLTGLFLCHQIIHIPAGVWALNEPLISRLFMFIPEPCRWLGDSQTAMLSCVLPMVWAGMGPGCLIYLAALKGIPDDFYEAADLDGATFIDKILFVVFPMLKPLLIINFVGVFIASWLHATANILAMTGGSADTEVAGLHIFYKAFIYLKFGPATAMAWVLGSMLIGFTVYQLQILSRLEFRTTGDDQ